MEYFIWFGKFLLIAIVGLVAFCVPYQAVEIFIQYRFWVEVALGVVIVISLISGLFGFILVIGNDGSNMDFKEYGEKLFTHWCVQSFLGWFVTLCWFAYLGISR